jgi:phospholipid/cholesterol/gamma-HCH transport system substrate-binding protein
METRANYTLVGGFVVFFLIAIVVFILWIARIGFSHNATHYDIYFSGSVTGLKDGGTVLYRGVPVGTVERIILDPLDVEKVCATIVVEGGVPIKEDAYASLEFQGLTGASYIQLNGGTRTAPRLRPKQGHSRAIIPARASVFEEVTASLPAVLQQMSRTFEEARTLFTPENRAAFGESLKNIHAITSALAPHPGKEDTLKNLNDLLLNIKEGVKDIQSVATELKALLKENRQSIRDFTGTGLPTFTQFLTEGKEAFTTLRRVSESLERSPSRFIYNDPKQGVKVP